MLVATRFVTCCPHLAVTAENRIRLLLLGVRHVVIERLEGGGELLETLRMRLGDLRIGLEIVDRRHGLGLGSPGLGERVHGACIIPHHLRDVFPEVFLCWRDLQLRMQQTYGGHFAVSFDGPAEEAVAVKALDRHPEYRPDLLLWVPNLAIIAVGIWLFSRIDKK